MPYEKSLDLQNGPLWSVRLLPYSPASEDFIKQTTSVGVKEEPTLKHVCHFVLLFSHTIVDGYTCMRVVRCLVKLVNAIIAGEDLDETQQIGTLLDVNREAELLREIESKFLKDPDLLERRRKSIASFPMETIFERAFPAEPLSKTED